jgi:hypothetical protein
MAMLAPMTQSLLLARMLAICPIPNEGYTLRTDHQRQTRMASKDRRRRGAMERKAERKARP